MAEFIPKKVIVHHSLTKDSLTVSWGAIRRYHIHTMMWRDVGYHAGVELVQSGAESYYETFMGRMWDKRGAHTRGQNFDSLGICFVGNYDIVDPPQMMLEAGARIIALWMKLFDIEIDKIYAHSHYSNKTCPGARLNMEYFKTLIERQRSNHG